ncbi:hypothetical protein AB6A40_004861 [Gnathostoma spinigerum]|uniref:Globin domain-containing protein n=1 Tax=Gnathostoma spinigerum TaxID=75299 RepID=A0ABD6EN99_9BILA
MLQDANEISKTYPVKGDCLTADMARASSLQDENSPSLSSSPITSPSRKRSVQLELRRISNIQYVQSVSGRRTSTTILPLTSAQIHLVRSQWRQVYITKGPTVIGTSLFHRLFFKSQNTKQLFERCRLPKQFANLDSFAKAHAKATGQLIDQIVDSLDDLEPMSIELIRIGRLHAQMLPGEFTGTVWNLTAETFIDCTLEWGDKRCRSETLRQAWALITAYVMDKIREGHNEERKRQIQISSSFSASPRRPS